MAAAVPAGAGPLVVLLVEDDPADSGLITARLQSADDHMAGPPLRVLHADSAAAARATLRDAHVDVIVLDLTLPDADGLDALRQVHAAARSIPIIVLARSGDQELALETLRAGAQDYLLKPPPDGATLHRILRYARERHRLLRELDTALHATDAAARRWRLLAETSRTLAGPDERRAALHSVATLVVPDVADCFALVVIGDDEVPTMLEVWHGDVERAGALRARVQAALDGPGAGAAALSGLASLDDVVRTAFETIGMPAATTVPLDFGGRKRGIVALAAAPGRSDAVTDVEFARSLANHICLALEQDRLLRQTQRAAAARDRAVGIVSHDLRNPLGTIQICATALLDPEPPPMSGVRQMAALIQRSAAWMEQIVRDLLDRASLDAGRLPLRITSTVVSDVVDAAHIMFAPIASGEAIEFSASTAPGLPRIDADPNRLLQVLTNLLGNAVKFTPAGGRVALSAAALGHEDPAATTQVGSGVRFTVSDTGPGISAEDLPHVFDWFWRSPNGERAGTGLGLSIAKGLVEAHGAHLRVESSLGAGSTFWFALPASSDTAPSSSDRGGEVS